MLIWLLLRVSPSDMSDTGKKPLEFYACVMSAIGQLHEVADSRRLE
jgi:hypothetical protein